MLTFFGYYLIIATHFHYTVDVIVGFAFSIIIWSFYHQVVLSSLELGGTMNLLDRVVSWLEGGAEDVQALKIELEKWHVDSPLATSRDGQSSQQGPGEVASESDEEGQVRNRSSSAAVTALAHNP